MGKGLIIVAVGISILITMIGFSLNDNATKNTSATTEFYENTKARIIANSGVEIYLEKMRRNKTLKGTFNDNELMDGEYDISIYGPDSSLKIKSKATFANKIHQTLVTAKRTPVEIPTINSAIYISSDNLSLNLAGNMDIDGNDHNVDGSNGPKAPLPGISVDGGADSSFIINSLKPKISNSILGKGGSPSVRVANDSTDWLALTESFIYAADINLSSGNYSTLTLGTFASPKITYADGNVSFAGGVTGSGILIINGNLSLSGNFTFKGIIIAYGQSTIRTTTVGNAGIYGAAIFVGQNVDILATGNSKFYYSSQAIQNAKDNLKSSRFSIVSWWE